LLTRSPCSHCHNLDDALKDLQIAGVPGKPSAWHTLHGVFQSVALDIIGKLESMPSAAMSDCNDGV
jgi:hypothetical protein